MAGKTLLQAIMVTAELMGTTFSAEAARVLAADLSRYPESQVLAALVRCRREVRGRLTLADILTRLEDGRPGVEEAWAMIPRGEEETVVWTPEMREAWAVVRPLLLEGETVAARVAFKEKYLALLMTARDDGTPVRWEVSPGYDATAREAKIREAVEGGRLPISMLNAYPTLSISERRRGELTPLNAILAVQDSETKGEKTP